VTIGILGVVTNGTVHLSSDTDTAQFHHSLF